MRKQLKEARMRAGLTQQQMAEKLDISLRYYKNIEAGERTGDVTLWDELEDLTGNPSADTPREFIKLSLQSR